MSYKTEFIAEFDEWFKKWQELDAKLVDIVNEYMENCPEEERDDFGGLDYGGTLERRLDSLAERRGWVEDRLDGRSFSDRRMTKKIRKALGYSIP